MELGAPYVPQIQAPPLLLLLLLLLLLCHLLVEGAVHAQIQTHVLAELLQDLRIQLILHQLRLVLQARVRRELEQLPGPVTPRRIAPTLLTLPEHVRLLVEE